MPEGREERHTTEAWCSREDVLEGPVTAALHTGTTTYACRTGKSPKYELLRAVREDVGLKRCLSWSEGSGVTDVSLLVDGEGRIEVVADDDAQDPCVAKLRLLRAMKLGCRWRVDVSIGAYSL
ncbi:MAG: hypothetical protein QM723_19945 [Myxococcaceae bacterium]